MTPVQTFPIEPGERSGVLDTGFDAAIDALIDPLTAAAERARELLEEEQPNLDEDPEQPAIEIVSGSGEPFTSLRLERDGEGNRFRLVLVTGEDA